MKKRKRLDKAVHYLPSHGIVYLGNPKVACSTIKRSLWSSFDVVNGDQTLLPGISPHDRLKSPFVTSIEDLGPNLDDLVSAEFFTVVRNPFSRILSGYLNKVTLDNRDPNVWGVFSRQAGFDIDARPSFGNFLEALYKVDPQKLAAHFAPQFIVTCVEDVTPDYIGRLENFDEVEHYLQGREIPVVGHAPHKSGAQSKIPEYFGARELEIVTDYYCRDFEIFGYSIDPETLRPVRPVALPRQDRNRLREAIDGAFKSSANIAS